jgi:hypothetical protein
MDLLLIYFIIVCGVVLLPLLIRLSTAVGEVLERHMLTLILKHLIYPFLYRRMRLLQPVTRFHFSVLLVYVAATLFFNFWRVTTAAEASSRAGLISTANFVPLLFSSRMSIAADLSGLNVRTVASAHTVFGLCASIQAAVHAILATRVSDFTWTNLLDLYGFLVSSTPASLCSSLITK